jgi:LacI family transcriptional regulator
MPVTLNELARLAGVSNATVSYALSEHKYQRVNKDTRERILSLARKYGYRRNLAGQALVKGKAYRLTICVKGYLASMHSAMDEPSFYEQFVFYSRGIQSAGYGLDLFEVRDDQSPELISRALANRFSDGFILLFWPQDMLAKILFSLKEKRVPAVASGTVLHADDFTWTGIDEYDVFARATERLLEAGHDKIAFFDVHGGSIDGRKRQAFLDTIRKRLGRDAGDWVFPLLKPRVAELVETTHAALDRIDNVRAFLVSENIHGHVVNHALQLKGLTPGKDCRVIGYGESFEAQLSKPKLSHYCVKNATQVEFGFEALIDQITNFADYEPRHQLVKPQFVELDT